MATQLKSIVRFVNVAVGATVSGFHGLRWSPPGGGDQLQVPDILIPSRGGFTVTADDTNVTVTNNTGVIASIDVLAELWNTPDRAFGAASILELTPRPFVVDLDAGSSGLGAVLGFGAAELANVADSVVNMPPWYEDDGEAGPPAGAVQIPVPRAGTLRNLFVRNNKAGAPGVITYTVTKNGAPTTLVVANLNSGAIGQGSDTTHSVAVAAGDAIGLTATIGEEGGGGVCSAVATILFDD